jgi:hypothetical protein
MTLLPAFPLLWSWLPHPPIHVDTCSQVLDTAYSLRSNCSILLYLKMPGGKGKEGKTTQNMNWHHTESSMISVFTLPKMRHRYDKTYWLGILWNWSCLVEFIADDAYLESLSLWFPELEYPRHKEICSLLWVVKHRKKANFFF